MKQGNTVYRGTLYPVESSPSEQKHRDRSDPSGKDSTDETEEGGDVYTAFLVYYKHGEWCTKQNSSLRELLLELAENWILIEPGEFDEYVGCRPNISTEELMDLLLSEAYQYIDSYRLVAVMKGGEFLGFSDPYRAGQAEVC